MNYKRKIFIVCLTTVAMCASILPLFASAADVFTLGETYQFTPPGDVSELYNAYGSFLGDIYFEGQDKLNDLDVVSVEINVQIWGDVEPSNQTYDISFGVICSGFYPTGEQQIPVYYDMIFYQVGQDTIYINDSSPLFIVQVATLVDEEVVMLDTYSTEIDKILFTPTGFADETIPTYYPYLVSWFTEVSVINNPYLPFADDYIDNINSFIQVIVSEMHELLINDNFWSIVIIVNATVFCGAVLSILLQLFRRF